MQDIDNHNQYHKKRKSTPVFLPFVFMVLVCALLVAGLISLFNLNDDGNEQAKLTGASVPAGDLFEIMQGDMPDGLPSKAVSEHSESVLYPAIGDSILSATPVNGNLENLENVTIPIPDGYTFSQYIYSGSKKIQNFSLTAPIYFPDPLNAQSIPGILTFRGTSYRNAPSWGFVQTQEEKLEQAWEFSGIGGKQSTDGTFTWSGVGWTGQALVVEWSPDVQSLMNIYSEKKAKAGLSEVIVAALDGNVYFLDLDDGRQTRPPLYVGATVKGTPTVDPRGYPILYLGQGDENADDEESGFWIYSLINGELLYRQKSGNDNRSVRPAWGCADASPLISPGADVLIFPSENGLIYIYELNTQFNPATGKLSISPEASSYVYSYQVSDQTGPQAGIESSIAIYNRYGYWVDNSGNLVCLDLQTLQMLWIYPLGDLSDVTPVIEEEGNMVSLYIATRVENQRPETEAYVGAAYTYKFNALTGEILWRTSYPSYMDANEISGAGGVYGTPIVGKYDMSDLVIFPYTRTKDGNEGSTLVAFNKSGGEKIWTYEMSSISLSSPVDCYRASDQKGYIVMTDNQGQVHLVNKDGELLDSLQLVSRKGTQEETKGFTIEATPVVYKGRLIIGTRPGGGRPGSVFAVDLR